MFISKKIVSILLILISIFLLVSCTTVSKNPADNENISLETTTKSSSNDVISPAKSEIGEQDLVSTPSGSNVLVVYFSVTGNTENVATRIASVTNADVYEIVPAVGYTDADIDYGDSNSRTSKEQDDASVRPEIKSKTISLDGYDTIYIGYPIWWGEEPRIMDTFVESYDFGDITIIPFCTSGSSGIGNSGKNLAANAGSGKWIDGQRFDANVSESEIEAWINGLK